jgi:hypothetical protein
MRRVDPASLCDSVSRLLFHGTADDAAPIGLCRAYVERLRSALMGTPEEGN